MLFDLRRVFSGALALSALASAIPTITTKGSKFFTSDGNQFFVKGIAYQLAESDPLLDGKQCQMDAKLMSGLGANVIRVYHVEDGNHDACMKAFADNGIYLFLDLDTFNTQIEEDSPHWNQTQEEAFERVMDSFHSYDNTAGFFIGNEVVSKANHSEAIVYAKAATRDLKSYRDSKGYRKIPVGYSAADIAELRPNLQNYLACGSNTTETIDFFGLNAYEWCGGSSYTQSGYNTITDQIKNYPVPIFFSEDGCNTVPPRTFDDQAAIFGPQMSPYWSGAIIYEWIQEANHFGLVAYGDTPSQASASIPATASIARSGTPTPVTPDYSNLKSVWASATPSSVSSNAYSPSLTAPPCPALTPGTWEVQGNVQLPQVGASLDSSARSSINSGATPTGASPSPSSTSKGAASGGQEVASAAFGLMSVVFGFMWWL